LKFVQGCQMSIYYPHDKTFRNAMKDIQVAMEFFHHYLPANIRPMVDLKTLILRDGTYIDPDFREFQSDILYQANINNNPGFLYLLIEHFSSAKELTPFALLQYKVGIWSDFIKSQRKKVKKLPLIIPMVFYNGTKPYDKPRHLSKIIEGPPEIIEEILFKDFHLIDTNLIEDESLREQLWSGILTFAFKHSRDREFKNAFVEFCKRAGILLGKMGERAVPLVELLLKYQSIVGEWKNTEEMVQMAESNLAPHKNKESIMVTLAGYYGEIGRKEGESAVLLRQLQHKYGNLPAYYRNKIEQADTDTLLIWAERVLDAKRLEDIFEEMITA